MQNIDIQLKRSKKLFVLMSGMFVISIALILFLQMNVWFKFFILVVTLIYGAWIFKCTPILSRIRHMDGNAWYLFSNQEILMGELMGESTVTGLVSVLRFNIPEERRKRSYVIFNDSMTVDEYRRFMVYLRCFRPKR